MKKILTFTLVVGLLALGYSHPASASSETRLKTVGMSIWVSKSYFSPQGGCIDIPFRYKWGKVYRVDTIASISIYDPNDQLIGDVYWRADLSQRRGEVFVKVCDTAWMNADGYQISAAIPGKYQLDLDVADLDNPKGKHYFQDKSTKIRLR
jgi:hypothetical protein